MGRLRALLAAVLAIAAASAARGEDGLGPGDYRFRLDHDGLERTYLVHVPPGYRPSRPTPLVVALHGGGGSAAHQAGDGYGLMGKADREGTIVAFPNGFSRLPSGLLATWNAGLCCGLARDRQVDDVGFIKAMVEQLQTRLSIDRSRIFATGMSNGGLMAYRLACELPGVFKAIAAVAGSDNTASCSPGQPVSVLHIHARDDDHILYGGGAGPGAFRNRQAVTEFRSVPETIARWVKFDACGPAPRTVLQKPGATCELYSGCAGEARVELCVTDSGGHSWPGGYKLRGGQPPSQALSANDLIWDFFLRPRAAGPQP